MNNFADRLRTVRGLRKLTQAALAKACGLSQGAIANYESSNRQSAKDIFKLAGVLRVNALWLQLGDGPMEPPPEAIPGVSDYQLIDVRPAQGLAAWPFQDISPDEYWALSDDDRALIENTVAALVASLRRKRPTA